MAKKHFVMNQWFQRIKTNKYMPFMKKIEHIQFMQSSITCENYFYSFCFLLCFLFYALVQHQKIKIK